MLTMNNYGTENCTSDNIEDTTKYGRVLLEALQIGQEYWATYIYGGVRSRYRFLVVGRDAEGGLRIAPSRSDPQDVVPDYVSHEVLTHNIVFDELKYWYTEDSVPRLLPSRSRVVTLLEIE